MTPAATIGFHGFEIAVRSFSGARAVRVVHPGGQEIAVHRHDWPFLTIPLLGGYIEQMEQREVSISGPSVVLHPAGRCHANSIQRQGMETLSIEFDPAWVNRDGTALPMDESRCWVGGRVAIGGRRLAEAWIDPTNNEVSLQHATVEFLSGALFHLDRALPRWFDEAARFIEQNAAPTTQALARALELNPAWLARAYRDAAGEGLQETLRRRRVEAAVDMLRATDDAIADIAIATGFCDQSHLNRAVLQLAGRTPMTLRHERDQLRRIRLS